MCREEKDRERGEEEKEEEMVPIRLGRLVSSRDLFMKGRWALLSMVFADTVGHRGRRIRR